MLARGHGHDDERLLCCWHVTGAGTARSFEQTSNTSPSNPASLVLEVSLARGRRAEARNLWRLCGFTFARNASERCNSLRAYNMGICWLLIGQGFTLESEDPSRHEMIPTQRFHAEEESN